MSTLSRQDEQLRQARSQGVDVDVLDALAGLIAGIPGLAGDVGQLFRYSQQPGQVALDMATGQGMFAEDPGVATTDWFGEQMGADTSSPEFMAGSLFSPGPGELAAAGKALFLGLPHLKNLRAAGRVKDGFTPGGEGIGVLPTSDQQGLAAIPEGDPAVPATELSAWRNPMDDRPVFELSDDQALFLYDQKQPALGDLSVRDLVENARRGPFGAPTEADLQFVLDHPELYDAAPWLADVTVDFSKQGKGASWNNAGSVIKIGMDNTPTQMRSSLLHEVQHALQSELDWFDPGQVSLGDSSEWWAGQAKKGALAETYKGKAWAPGTPVYKAAEGGMFRRPVTDMARDEKQMYDAILRTTEGGRTQQTPSSMANKARWGLDELHRGTRSGADLYHLENVASLFGPVDGPHFKAAVDMALDNPDKMKRVLERVQAEARKDWDALDQFANPNAMPPPGQMDLYFTNAGEIEARLTQRRAKLTPEERANINPYGPDFNDYTVNPQNLQRSWTDSMREDIDDWIQYGGDPTVHDSPAVDPMIGPPDEGHPYWDEGSDPDRRENMEYWRRMFGE